MNIVYEDKHIIVIEKPAGMPSQADKTGDENMCGIVRAYTGDVWLVHRLDRPVGGLLLFARSEQVCRKLSADMAGGCIQKTYLAVVCGRAEQSDSLEHYLVKNARLNMSKVVHKNEKGAKAAILCYQCLEEIISETDGPLSLLEIDLKTGRHHQIRAQLAHAGLPIWGDTKYNIRFVNRSVFVNIALWAYKLSFIHPESRQKLDFCLNPPEKLFPFSCFDMYRNI